MIFLLVFLVLALSSAKPIENTQPTLQGGTSQKAASLGYMGNTCQKANLCNEDCNASGDPARLVPRCQHSLSVGVRPMKDIHNGPDAPAELVTVTLRRPDQLPSTNWHTLEQDPTDRARESRNRADTILKRNNEVRLIHFKTYTCMVPATIAAVQMKLFFDGIARAATHSWPSAHEQSALFTVTQGQLQLTMSCLGGTIPWPMIASAAQNFAFLATSFFVSTFDAYYMDIASSRTIAISLRLLETRAQTPTRALQSLPKAPHHQRDIASKQLPALTKRTPPSLNSPTKLAVTMFKSFTTMVPTALMASRFEDFYNIIALKIETGQFAQYAPTKMRILMLWDFELSFSCDKIDVPWSFVQAFVLDMAEWSSRTFTGFYEATIRGEGPLAGLVFLVKMRLRDPPPKG